MLITLASLFKAFLIPYHILNSLPTSSYPIFFFLKLYFKNGQ